MIEKEFIIDHLQLKYYVGISQVRFELNQFIKDYKITSEEDTLNYLFKILEEFQNKNKEAVIQLIKDKYVLNQEHIFIACYFLQKALFYDTLISNKNNIELLLYLSTYRQISKGIKSFGLSFNDLKKGTFIICIISPTNNLQNINNEILRMIRASEINATLNNLTFEKIKEILKHFDLSELQIRAVLNSYGIKNINLEKHQNLQHISLAIFDLICEKMALLNLEKFVSR
ncbi:MAG: KEOPS complex subunit Cgi121 [Candidatus Thorarchaeota archaeon]